MEKNIIGSWGADLDDNDYAKAIAALGALEATATQRHTPPNDAEALRSALEEEFGRGETTAVWRNAYNPSGGSPTPTSWQDTIHKDASALSEAWRLYLESTRHHPRLMPRLAVEAAWQKWPELVDLDNLFEVLSYSGVGSLSLLPQDKYGRDLYPDWHWPVRVGVPAGPDSERLFVQLQSAAESNWVAELAHVTRVGAVRDNCDLLILPSGWAEQLAGRSDVRLRASFVVCLDDPVSWNEAARSAILDEVRKKTGAAGIALVGRRDGSDLEYWYRELIRELSHDVPLHAALWEAGRRAGVVPIVSGFPDYLDRLRILSVAERMDRQWDLLSSSGAVAKDLEPGLADDVRKKQFDSEEGYGLPYARKFAERETQMEGFRQPRWIQAGIARPDSDSGAFAAGALAAEQPNLVAVFIGPTLEERTDQPFPDRKFDFSDGPIPLQVQFELANASIAALRSTELGDLLEFGINRSDDLVSRRLRDYATRANAPEPLVEETSLIEVATETIALPAIGTSKPAYFVVWPQAGAAKVKGRIAIIHNNRIAQTAKFEAPVGLETTPANPLVQTEQVQFSRLEDLPKRREFDLTVMVADDLGSRLNLTINRDATSVTASIGNLAAEITDIQNIILATTRREESRQIIAEDNTVNTVLRSLAVKGRIIYNELTRLYPGIFDELPTGNGELRVEVMSATETFFPLEHVYSGPSPQVGAAVCPNAVAALRQGNCGDCENRNSNKFVCPNHFWGWKHVIQRRASGASRAEGGRDAVGPTRTQFGPFTRVLFAASSKAFNFPDGQAERDTLLAALRALGVLAPEVTDWDQWRAIVTSQPPINILVLLPHTDTIPINQEVLEIGQEKQLGKNEIMPGILGPANTPKLLIVIGCTVAEVTEKFAGYHGLFQNAGANVIVTSMAKILGRDAVPIATEIAKQLTARLAAGDEIALGELTRDMRRQMLADGHSGVLGILCLGDADWVLGG